MSENAPIQYDGPHSGEKPTRAPRGHGEAGGAKRAGALPKSTLAPIHRDGHAALLIAALAAVAGFYLWWPLGVFAALVAAAILCAFRDPARVTPQREGLVVAPADGVVLAAKPRAPPAELDLGDAPLPMIAISIGLFDVHVNRVPVEGTVEALSYRPGLFVNPTLDKADVFNERQSLRIRTVSHGDVGVVQIAGLLARRIVASVTEGEAVKTGQRFGLIRFGSRVDVYLPAGTSILVAEGQRMVAGETVIADFASREGSRPGAVR